MKWESQSNLQQYNYTHQAVISFQNSLFRGHEIPHEHRKYQSHTIALCTFCPVRRRRLGNHPTSPTLFKLRQHSSSGALNPSMPGNSERSLPHRHDCPSFLRPVQSIVEDNLNDGVTRRYSGYIMRLVRVCQRRVEFLWDDDVFG